MRVPSLAFGPGAAALGALFAVGVAPILAAEATATPVQPDRARAIEAFVDELMAREMAALDVPGAVVVLVEDSRTVIAKGYGLADRETATPVDLEATAFRIASVGKLFTTLAVLGLEGEGRLDLQRDVNGYLEGLKLPEDRWPPPTLHQLLVHAGGFDERLIGYQARGAGDFPELGDYLARRMPPRGHAPGEVQSYSNHGFALAGYVAECVAGEPLRRLVGERVLAPLGMTDSGFVVPTAERLLDALATEYWATGDVAEVAFSRPYPAGSFATTGRDMERFLLALGGALEGRERPPFTGGVLDRLVRTQFRQHPEAPGETYGFAEHFLSGTRVLVRGGAAPAHSGLVAVMPPAGDGRAYAGLFVAVNRQEPQLWERLLAALVGHFHATPREPRPTVAAELDRYAGTYLWTRNASRSLERILELATQVEVRVAGDRLQVSGLASGAEGGYRPVGGGLFLADDDSYLAFRESGDEVRYLFRAVDGEHFAFRRIGWLAEAGTQLALVAGCLLVLVSWLLGRLARLALSRIRGQRPSAPGFSMVWADATALALLGSIAGLVTVIASWRDLLTGPTPLLRSVLVLILASVAGTLGTTWVARRAWSRRLGSTTLRTHLTLVALASWVFGLLFWYYNLIGFRY